MTAVAGDLAVFGIARAANVTFQFPTPEAASGTTTVVGGTVAAVAFPAMVVGRPLAGVSIMRHRPTFRTTAIVGGVFGAASMLLPLSIHASTTTELTLVRHHLIVEFSSLEVSHGSRGWTWGRRGELFNNA